MRGKKKRQGTNRGGCQPKEIVTMRLDVDLLRWFRRERGYQTCINAIVRAYMQAYDSE